MMAIMMMMKKEKTDNPKPKPQPAPQLPNLPWSPDDPFHPDPERKEPVTKQPDDVPPPSPPSSGRFPSKPAKEHDGEESNEQ
jgi:hypothetical protein